MAALGITLGFLAFIAVLHTLVVWSANRKITKEREKLIAEMPNRGAN